MRALIQRVVEARVIVADKVVGQIGPGLLVLVCAMRGDTEEKSAWLARKVANLRIFPDDEGRMNRSLIEVGAALLAVPQFTLVADTKKGSRPSFSSGASPEAGMRLFERFVEFARRRVHVETGRFGAEMRVALVNDGPVTFWLQAKPGS
jgi:D-tyrosyl-tRNA(Tyr) deacylase